MQKNNASSSYPILQSFLEQKNFVEKNQKRSKRVKEIYEFALAEPEDQRSLFIQKMCDNDLSLINDVQELFERSKRVEEIYELALAEPENQRSLFIQKMCDDDLSLINNVQELFAADRLAEQKGFLGTAQRAKIQQLTLLPDVEIGLTEGLVLAGKYQIEQFIKKGGMGAVYLATQLNLTRKVAIKVISNDSRSFKRRFEQEAKITANLQDPSIVVIYDYGVEKNIPYMVMEYLEGINLQDEIAARLKNNRIYTPKEALLLLEPIINALSKIHQKNIIHRDLKPANIILTRISEGECSVKLIDLGIARIVEDSFDFSSTSTSALYLIGTPDYMSPEQIRHESDLDQRSDIYSLGIIFYELVTGKKPFSGGPISIYEKQLVEKPKFLHEVDSSIPEDFSLVIARALSKNRQDRPPNCKQFLSELHFALKLDSKNKSIVKGLGMQQQSIINQMRTIEQKLQLFCEQAQAQDWEYNSLWEKLEKLRSDIDVTNNSVSLEMHHYRNFRSRLNQLCNTFIKSVEDKQQELLGIDNELIILEESSNEENLEKITLNNQIQELKSKHELEKISFLSEIIELKKSIQNKMFLVWEQHISQCKLFRQEAETLRSDKLHSDKLHSDMDVKDTSLEINYYQSFNNRLNRLRDSFVEAIENNEPQVVDISNELATLEEEFPTKESLEKTKLNNQMKKLKNEYELEKIEFLSIINELANSVKSPTEIISQKLDVLINKVKKTTSNPLITPNEIKDNVEHNKSKSEENKNITTSTQTLISSTPVNSNPNKIDTHVSHAPTDLTNNELPKPMTLPLINSGHRENSPVVKVSMPNKSNTFFSSINFFVVVHMLLCSLLILTFIVLKSLALTVGVIITAIFFTMIFFFTKTNKK